MLIHSLAETYSLLPSDIIARATTFDMVVLDIASTYRNIVQERAMSGKTGTDPKSYSVEDLLKIKEKASASSKKD